MAMTHEHTPLAISTRLSRGARLSYLRDWVYGGIDGAVTTFAVVSGVVGAGLASRTIVILGIANLIADGFSMAAANYLGTKSEQDEMKYLSGVEAEHIKKYPEGETEEVRQILKAKGFDGELLDQAVRVFTSSKEAWIRFMLTEEYGLPQSVRKPGHAALSTFISFVLCGAVPLFPYLMSLGNQFVVSSLLTGLVFFSIGSIKSQWSVSPWWKSGLVTLLVGASAASLAYFIGMALRGFS